MIKISGALVDPNSINGQWPLGSIGRNIIDKMAASNLVYVYDTVDELKFELKLRINTIAASRALYKSGVSFATFYNSRCNSAYWNRTSEGGFQLKPNVKPSTAVLDIFNNGSKYAFECATAMVIVYYKAVIDTIQEELFNKLFMGIYLMDWRYDEDLGLTWEKQLDYFPGDRRYFKNPQVNPLTPEWQGENVINLGDGTYYGHGIGIRTGAQMIASLNAHRKPGATQSAYLMDKGGHPNFKYLAKKYHDYMYWREVNSYQLYWKHDIKHGGIAIFLKDIVEPIRVQNLGFDDYRVLVDILRKEKPVYYHQLYSSLSTLYEIAGEEEA